MSSSTDLDDMRQRKEEFRKQIRAKVRELKQEETMAQSMEVWERVYKLPSYQTAKSVGLFLSMPKGEINTDPILQHAIQNGKDVFVPQVGKDYEMCDMNLVKVIVGDPNSQEIFHKSWPRNKWQIPEPPADMPIVNAKPGDIDLLLVPGLAFDLKRNRLGQGKGYYDRFIAKMTVNDMPLPLVAVGLTPQFVSGAEIPVDRYDKQMDMVIFPDKVIS